jgi:uncharacterized protein (TIGR03032 family)
MELALRMTDRRSTPGYGVPREATAAVPPPAPAPEATKISVSKGLAAWLVAHRTSFAVTSYQSGRLLLAGSLANGNVSVHQQSFSRAMGLCWSDGRLYLASRVQLWELENILPPGKIAEGGFDVQLMPRRTFITGDIDVHEVAVDGGGRPIFVNTAYSCLATVDEIHSFRPIWKPSFISELVREDRCHMNGLGMVDGKPKYVTAVSQTDVADGWHGRPLPKGVLIDVESDRIVTDSLSMPHSPRLVGDRLYALNSGRGFIVRIDPETGAVEDVAFCPGFLRGLAIVGNYALVTVSKPRYGTFDALPIGDEMERRQATPMCGVLVVDLTSGDIVEWLKLEGDIQELFAVVLMPGVACPMSIGPDTPEFPDAITFDPRIVQFAGS